LSDIAKLCRRAGITKAELARRLGLRSSTVYHWTVAPRYAIAYLELVIELNRYRP